MGVMSLIIVALVGLLGGLAGALQAQSVGVMEAKAGNLAAVFVTYGGGGLVVGLLMLVFHGGRLSDLRQVPWWAFTAGLMGLVIIAALGFMVSNVGLAAGLTLFTSSVLVLGALIEHVGWFGDGRAIDPARLLGIGLVILGTWLVVRG